MAWLLFFSRTERGHADLRDLQMLWVHCRGEVATSWVNGTISRALLRQDRRLANTLCNNTDREVRSLSLVGKGEVTLNHWAASAADYVNVHRDR